jgi:hypothetical protein
MTAVNWDSQTISSNIMFIVNWIILQIMTLKMKHKSVKYIEYSMCATASTACIAFN